MRRLQFTQGSSDKFWQIERRGTSLRIEWGRVGTSGQTQTKELASEALAKAAHDKLVAEKLKKGYVEVSAQKATATKPVTAKPIKAKPVATKPVKTQPVTSKPIKAKPVATKSDTTVIEAHARELSVIVPQLFAASVKYYEKSGLDTEGTFEECLGPPCSADDIAQLERDLGRPLPPSYHAFLTLYSHWKGFPAGCDLLGPAGQRSEATKEALDSRADLFREFEPVNPIADGALPLAVSEGRPIVLFELPVRDDGEMDIVDYDLTEEMGRWPNLVAFMKSDLERTLGYLEPKSKAKSEKAQKVKPTKETKVEAKTPHARNPTEAALFALDSGDGAAVLAALARMKDPANAIRLLGVRADNSRVSVKVGQAVLHLSDFLFARKPEEITRFIPTMAIAAVHLHQEADEAQRQRAQSILARLPPLVAANEDEAELIAAWATGLQEKRAYREAIELFEVALACPKMSPRSLHSAALFVILRDFNQLPIDEPRARRFVAVCLPHGDKEPAIFHYAAAVLAELGDDKGVMELLERARQVKYDKLELMKSNCGTLYPALSEKPEFKAFSTSR